MNKKAQGFTVRTIASVIMVVSLPFIIVNPMNTIAQISLAFGTFLLVLGGVLP